MRSRIFAFACLILLFGWGCYEIYHVMYVHFAFQTEVPRVWDFDYDKPHACPEDQLATYVLSVADRTLIEGLRLPDGKYEGLATIDNVPRNEGGRAKNDGGIKLADVRIRYNPAVVPPPQTQPQTQPAGRSKIDYLDWSVVQQEAKNAGLDVIWSGGNSRYLIEIVDPLGDPNRPEWKLISGEIAFIVPPGMGTCPRTGIQLDGSGIPWAAIIGFIAFIIAFLLCWRTAFGSWASTILIETDHELNKVNWPTRQIVYNSSLIVILCILMFGAILFTADWLLNLIFKWLDLF